MAFRLTLTGVGAMASPRFAPAGLLIDLDGTFVMIDGGDRRPPVTLDAWLVTDGHSELIREIRRLAAQSGLEPAPSSFHRAALEVDPRPVIHTSHETYGFLIQAGGHRIAWAPEFFVFPQWAAGSTLMFADGAAWDRPISFARGAGGHAAVLDTAILARRAGVARLVFAHIGRPTIRAIDRGERPPFGSFGHDGMVFEPRRWRSTQPRQ
jgi:hypothetical protein